MSGRLVGTRRARRGNTWLVVTPPHMSASGTSEIRRSIRWAIAALERLRADIVSRSL
jgi:hypothetical protein